MSLDELALSAQRAVDRLIRRLRRGAPPGTHAPAAPRRADRRPLARVLERGARVGAHALPRPSARASSATGWSRWRSACRRRRRPSTWRRCTGCAPTSRRFTTTIGSGVAISTSRGRARRGGRGQAGGGPARHPARRQRVRLRLHGRRRQQPLQLRQPHPAQGPRACSMRSRPSWWLAWVFVKSLTQTVFELARAAPALRRGSARGGRPLALADDQDRHLGVGAPVLHAGGVPRSLCRDAGDLRELPRLRRLGARLRPGQPAGHAVAAPGGQRDPPALARGLAASPSTSTTSTCSPTTARRRCRPYRDLSGGRRLERWIFDELLGRRPGEGAAGVRRSASWSGIRGRREGRRGLFQHFLNYIDEDFLRRRDPEAHERDGVRVISAGPNAFLYVLDAAAAA